jgi:hypothetical protein
MATPTGLYGPLALNVATIDTQVVGYGPGAYALGKADGDILYIKYVGRSDSDLNARLKNWAGTYTDFMYAFFPSAKAAFDKECGLFHDFGGTARLDNKMHPDRPNGSNWTCPRCGNFS